MPTALYRFILAALLLLPLAAHASDAEDFINANPMQQAKLLQDWAAQPDPARIELVDALQQGQISVNGETKTVRLNNRLRGLIDNVQASQELLAADPKVRLAAAQTLQKSAQPAQLKFLDQQLAGETNDDVHTALSLALANLQLVDPDPAVRLAAVRLLGGTGDPLARTRLEALLAPGVEADATVHTAAETSLAQVKRKLMVGEILGQAFSGMSLGSILLLAALGLAITFGLLGVINMAHGEMLMLGAYATLLVQWGFERFLPGAAGPWYFLAAVPAAFCAAAAAAAGWLLELTVIRHLYGRPLETLLATWGISYLLIQTIRTLFGDNQAVTAPPWLVGGWEPVDGLVLPWNRLFIIALTAVSVAAVVVLMRGTRLGLLLRATVQSRRTAASLGVDTRRIDGLTFAFGSGLAGAAGCAITLIGGLKPDMGQEYIIDSFLVVATGGVGNLAGVCCAGFGLGLLNKLLEPFTQAVYAKVLVLAAVILFLQWRPQGLFPPRGRLADA